MFRGSRAWRPDPALEEGWAPAGYQLGEHLVDLARTGEIFSFEFAETAFFEVFGNRRYEREGGIHVLPDDHIECKEVLRLSPISLPRWICRTATSITTPAEGNRSTGAGDPGMAIWSA